MWGATLQVVIARRFTRKGCPVGLPSCARLGYTRGLFTEFVRVARAMEIQPILNTIKDLTERSQSIRGYL